MVHVQLSESTSGDTYIRTHYVCTKIITRVKITFPKWPAKCQISFIHSLSDILSVNHLLM